MRGSPLLDPCSPYNGTEPRGVTRSSCRGELKMLKTVLRSARFLFRKARMSKQNEDPERMWDEYDWERFFQEQDRRMELYLDLLEKYADHPDKENLIAQEMGWPLSMVFDPTGICEDAVGGDAEEVAAGAPRVEETSSQEHALYRKAEELAAWLEKALRTRGVFLLEEPAVDELSEQLSILSANLVASQGGENDGELGMTIAFLKRSLRASNLALNATEQISRRGIFGRVRYKHLRECLLDLRNGIVRLMGEVRGQWRRLQDGSR